MKKIVSIILTVAMLLMSVLCIQASAAESKTEALINQMAESRSIRVTVANGTLSFDGLELKDVTLYAKVFANEDGTSTIKVAGEGKLFGLKAKLIVDDSGIKAYIPLLTMKIDITKIIGADVHRSNYTESINQLFDYLSSDYINCLKLSAAGEKEVEGYGNVYVEEFTPDVAAIARKAVESGAVTLPDGVDVDQLTEHHLIAYVTIAGGDVESISAMLKSSAEFYYVNDQLVGFKATIVNENGESQVIDSAQIIPFAVDSIASDVADDVFTVSGFYLDLTGIVQFILSLMK